MTIPPPRTPLPSPNHAPPWTSRPNPEPSVVLVVVGQPGDFGGEVEAKEPEKGDASPQPEPTTLPASEASGGSTGASGAGEAVSRGRSFNLFLKTVRGARLLPAYLPGVPSRSVPFPQATCTALRQSLCGVVAVCPSPALADDGPHHLQDGV